MLNSDKQPQANRENAEKSTGPWTPTGKHSSSRNTITHGALTAAAEAVAELGASVEDLTQLQAAFLDQYQPATPHAQFLVHEFAACVRKLRRIRFGLPLEPNPNLVGDAHQHSVDTLDKLSRQEARLRSHYLRLLGQLESLESGNEPQTAESIPLSQ